MVNKYQFKDKKEFRIVEAVQFLDDSNSIHEIFNFLGRYDVSVDYSDPNFPVLKIYLEDTILTANVGYYVIRTSNGKIFTCLPYLFELFYEKTEVECDLQKPSVGIIVSYKSPFVGKDLPAIITNVHEDGETVDLFVFNHKASQISSCFKLSIPKFRLGVLSNEFWDFPTKRE